MQHKLGQELGQELGNESASDLLMGLLKGREYKPGEEFAKVTGSGRLDEAAQRLAAKLSPTERAKIAPTPVRQRVTLEVTRYEVQVQPSRGIRWVLCDVCGKKSCSLSYAVDERGRVVARGTQPAD